ncbi:MAG: GNAT family N-acetyltransferase [Anaerolineae bacterium]
MSAAILIREYQPGDPSLVVHLHMALYRELYGFKGVFEHYVMQAMAEFLRDPSGGQLWAAVVDGAVVGSIAVVRCADDAAQLRWFAVAQAYQGRGIGTRLLDTALQFCTERGYSNLHLWTLEMLAAARHLYLKYGFSPTECKPNTSWTDGLLVEEKWERRSGQGRVPNAHADPL